MDCNHLKGKFKAESDTVIKRNTNWKKGAVIKKRGKNLMQRLILRAVRKMKNGRRQAKGERKNERADRELD